MKKLYELSEPAKCGSIYSSSNQKSVFELGQILAKEENKTIVMRQLIFDNGLCTEIHTVFIKSDGTFTHIN